MYISKALLKPYIGYVLIKVILNNEYILYFTSLYNCCQIIFTLNFVLSQRFRKGHYT